MDTARLIEIIGALPEEKQAEVLDFARFLRHQAAKGRIMASDKQDRLSFENADELLDAIENAD